MRRNRIVVLKFGGSVLTGENGILEATHEIYRHRRAGKDVLAVVSAIAGRTDALLRESASLGAKPTPHTLASFLATGEIECAARLALMLDRVGIPAVARSPESIALRADGADLDSEPVSVDVASILGALANHGVVVVPGFVAVDSKGNTVTLGRGGSDFTALFLAHALEVDRCLLLKDVDALYDRDPSTNPEAQRYVSASFSAALSTDGSITQHKAVRFAQTHAIPFELGATSGALRTGVGPYRTRAEVVAQQPRRQSVALLGLGVVGQGVLRLIEGLSGLEVTRIAVRDPSRSRAMTLGDDVLTIDAFEAATGGASIVVETIGGLEPARSIVEAALESGSHVVTANKRLLATHGRELDAIAARNGVKLLGSAAVGGSMPLLERLSARAGSIRMVRAVLNGTTNFVLDALSRGVSLEEALARARARGFAEADTSRDLNGLDAADKLILVGRAMGKEIDQGCIIREPISPERLQMIREGLVPGRSWRHVATIERSARGARAAVKLELLDSSDGLARVSDEWNAAEIRHQNGEIEVVRGRGAGRWATAQSVIADLLDIARLEGAPRDEPLLVGGDDAYV